LFQVGSTGVDHQQSPAEESAFSMVKFVVVVHNNQVGGVGDIADKLEINGFVQSRDDNWQVSPADTSQNWTFVCYHNCLRIITCKCGP
jgi:hypothetical protein